VISLQFSPSCSSFFLSALVLLFPWSLPCCFLRSKIFFFFFSWFSFQTR
jgi:hypothetical protein